MGATGQDEAHMRDNLATILAFTGLYVGVVWLMRCIIRTFHGRLSYLASRLVAATIAALVILGVSALLFAAGLPKMTWGYIVAIAAAGFISGLLWGNPRTWDGR